MTRRSLVPGPPPPLPQGQHLQAQAAGERSQGSQELFPLTPGVKAKGPAIGGESQGGASHIYFIDGFKEVEN